MESWLAGKQYYVNRCFSAGCYEITKYSLFPYVICSADISGTIFYIVNVIEHEQMIFEFEDAINIDTVVSKINDKSAEEERLIMLLDFYFEL